MQPTQQYDAQSLKNKLTGYGKRKLSSTDLYSYYMGIYKLKLLSPEEIDDNASGIRKVITNGHNIEAFYYKLNIPAVSSDEPDRNVTIVPSGAHDKAVCEYYFQPDLRKLDTIKHIHWFPLDTSSSSSGQTNQYELIIPLAETGMRNHWTVLHLRLGPINNRTIYATLYDSKDNIFARLHPTGEIARIIRDAYPNYKIVFNTSYLGNQPLYNDHECGYWALTYMKELAEHGAINSPSTLSIIDSTKTKNKRAFWLNILTNTLITLGLAAIITAAIYFTGGLALIPMLAGLSIIPQLFAMFAAATAGVLLLTKVAITPITALINFYHYHAYAATQTTYDKVIAFAAKFLGALLIGALIAAIVYFSGGLALLPIIAALQPGLQLLIATGVLGVGLIAIHTPIKVAIKAVCYIAKTLARLFEPSEDKQTDTLDSKSQDSFFDVEQKKEVIVPHDDTKPEGTEDNSSHQLTPGNK